MGLNIFKKKKTEEQLSATKPEPQTENAPEPIKTASGKDSAFSYQHIASPYLTEKTSILNAGGQYVFKVFSRANKIAIKKAVEQLYGVHVEKVRIMIIPGKRRQLGRFEGEKKGFKKAIIRLRAGEKIEVAAH